MQRRRMALAAYLLPEVMPHLRLMSPEQLREWTVLAESRHTHPRAVFDGRHYLHWVRDDGTLGPLVAAACGREGFSDPINPVILHDHGATLPPCPQCWGAYLRQQ